MLLEFIDGGNLTNYLLGTEPPQNAEETIKFWKAFLEVVKPLARIHTFPMENSDLQGYGLTMIYRRVLANCSR